jgi:hypothetical protein
MDAIDPANVEVFEYAWRKAAAKDFLTFIRGLQVPTQDKGPMLFENVMAPFQREFFEDIAPSLHALRRGELPECQRWWVERTKKASKDGDLGAILLWLIAFPIRPFKIQVGAADTEQAAIVKERIEHLLYWNPWLNERVMIRNNRVIGPRQRAMLTILAADVQGAHGGTPDLVVINELSHITKWEFAENMMSNADGVARGMVIVATNAGFRGTPAEDWRKNATTSPRWKAYILDKPAPWTNQSFLEEARRMLPASKYNRLWWGRWSSGKGDAINEEDLEACFKYDIKQLEEPEKGWVYVGGLDLGYKHDHAGFVLLGIPPKTKDKIPRHVRLVWMQGWEPGGPRHEVDLIDVRRTIYQIHQTFRPIWIGYDPEQAVHPAQMLRSKGVPMEPVPFTAGSLKRMASTFTQATSQRWLWCYDNEQGTLRRDFGKFSLVEKSYGVRLEATRDVYGHADVGTALLIALPRAEDLLNHYHGILWSPDEQVVFESAPLTQEAFDEMPDEFKELLGGASMRYGNQPFDYDMDDD